MRHRLRQKALARQHFNFQLRSGHRFSKRRLPCRKAIHRRGLECVQFLLQRGDFVFQFNFLLLLRLGENTHQRRFIAFVAVLRIIKNGEHLKIFLLAERIVLVIVALCTGHGGAHPRGHRRVHAVNHGDVAKLLIVGAAFAVGLGVAMKGGGDELVGRGRGQQIAGELVASKLVERLVVVDGADNPIAIRPNGARRIVGIARAVGITREVQPLARPMFAVGGL